MDVKEIVHDLELNIVRIMDKCLDLSFLNSLNFSDNWYFIMVLE